MILGTLSQFSDKFDFSKIVHFYSEDSMEYGRKFRNANIKQEVWKLLFSALKVISLQLRSNIKHHQRFKKTFRVLCLNYSITKLIFQFLIFNFLHSAFPSEEIRKIKLVNYGRLSTYFEFKNLFMRNYFCEKTGRQKSKILLKFQTARNRSVQFNKDTKNL